MIFYGPSGASLSSDQNAFRGRTRRGVEGAPWRPLRPTLVLLIGGLAACSGPHERHPEIAGSSTCADCRIDIRAVWTSAKGDNNVMTTAWYLERGDTLWALGGYALSRVTRFSLTTNESAIFDRDGEGPGEFRFAYIAKMHPAGDTLVIVHEGRISYLTTVLREVRSIPILIPDALGMTILPDGRLFMVSSKLREPASARGYALHEITSAGRYTRSFRSTDTASASGAWGLEAGSEPNTIWVVEPRRDGLVAEQWDVESLRRRRGFSFSPAWWVGETKSREEYEQMGPNTRAPKLPTGTVGVWDSGNVLWVVLRHFDPAHASQDLAHVSVSEKFDGVLLAMDRESGAVLATAVFDAISFGFTNRGRLVLYDEDDRTGEPRIRLAEVSLQRTGT